MNCYRVVSERDGATTKEPGKTSTEILRESHYYAAESIDEVWEAIAWLRNDPERTMIALIKEVDAMVVLPAGPAQEG